MANEIPVFQRQVNKQIAGSESDKLSLDSPTSSRTWPDDQNHDEIEEEIEENDPLTNTSEGSV